jgi:hypothetical protein
MEEVTPGQRNQADILIRQHATKDRMTDLNETGIFVDILQTPDPKAVDRHLLREVLKLTKPFEGQGSISVDYDQSLEDKQEWLFDQGIFKKPDREIQWLSSEDFRRPAGLTGRHQPMIEVRRIYRTGSAGETIARHKQFRLSPADPWMLLDWYKEMILAMPSAFKGTYNWQISALGVNFTKTSRDFPGVLRQYVPAIAQDSNDCVFPITQLCDNLSNDNYVLWVCGPDKES